MRAVVASARRIDLERRAMPTADGAEHTGTVLSVFGIKGGIGKTTIATNLALSLARETFLSVVLVDLDVPWGDVACMLDLTPVHDTFEALDSEVIESPERLRSQMLIGPEGVHVLPAPLVPDIEKPVEGALVSRLIGRLAALYDYVVVDLPPSTNEISAGAIDASDIVFMVTTPEVPCLRRTNACIRLLQRAQFPVEKLQIVLNRTGWRTCVENDQIEALLNYPVTWRIADDRTVLSAAAMGLPLVVNKPNVPIAVSIRTMARKVAGIREEPASTPLLSRICATARRTTLAGLMTLPLKGGRPVAA
jgi:pilus assembly protein CpaE